MWMQFCWNQSTPRCSAERVTAVGERRVSIGPFIRVMLRGVERVALGLHAGDGGHYRHGGLAHRHDVKVGAQRAEDRDQVIDVVVEIEAALRKRTTRASAQSVMWT